MQSVWSAWFSVLCLMWSIIPLSDWSVELRISAKYEKSTKLNFTSLETVEPTADVTARKVTINPVSGFGFVKSQSSWRHANRNFLTHFNSIIFKIRIDRALTLTFLFVSDVLHFIVIGWLGLARRGGDTQSIWSRRSARISLACQGVDLQRTVTRSTNSKP